jgi:hypothetical protein
MLGGLQKCKLCVLGERDTLEEFNEKKIERGQMFEIFPARVTPCSKDIENNVNLNFLNLLLFESYRDPIPVYRVLNFE